MIFPGFFHPSTLERWAVESMPAGKEREKADAEWAQKYPIEAANRVDEWRMLRLTYLCGRRLWKKIRRSKVDPYGQ
jgi:hypothetical protein